MKEVINADQSYQQVEEQARHYFQLLNEQVTKKSYIPKLVDDFQKWKVNHIHHPSFFSFFSSKQKKPSSKETMHYIKWLDYTNKLEDYLKRSISYIYLRDLGKTLEDQDTQSKIDQVVGDLKGSLIDSTKNEKKELFGFDWIIQKGKKEQILLTVDWMLSKLNTVSANIPEELDAANAQRKLIKIIAGVLMHTIDAMEEDISPSERREKLDKAIRLGYCYGLTYPFIDDLLDSDLLSKIEKEQFSQLIRTSLLTGKVPPLGSEWSEATLQFLAYIHTELKEAFEYIQTQQSSSKFFEQAYVFFHSQEIDRQKELSNKTYTNEELFVPIILKSSSSRLVARSVIQETEDDDGFEQRTFLYGIYNQLADDFADMFDDLKVGAVTPYTYYIQHQQHRNDLINPFEMYWAVISNLIHNVYHSHSETREVILNRAINGLKRFKEKHGKKKYEEVMKQFASGFPEFNAILQKMVEKGDDVDFFDKLLRDHMVDHFKIQRAEKEAFKEKIQIVKEMVNQELLITPDLDAEFQQDLVLEAANYSLTGEGKRLRPIMAWFVGVEMYGLEEVSLLPLFKSLEYMHTASLIFDDLPSQDNASYRRGRPTVHEMYNVAIGELTGLFLTQKAIEQQTLLEKFDSKTVLELVRYSAQVTANICKGQVMDLESKGRRFSKDELETMCFYKTALGFEAALVMPAILAKANEKEMNALKKFSRHAGIAFQIKDDLLDSEGNFENLGKSARMDLENETSTFVTILGIEGAKNEMWEHYCLAIEALESIPQNASFLKLFLNNIVHRDR
ncbi:polyprenyl synthetase family protein [Ureibacillus chungkukjangi]|uniref:Geranylgeranyl pyrophosphate synthase n=1 Tax=Ureibacillus chungkukjangi TaxID=1202712 RepID=A0A318TM10_9BACL|nr:polyprenyl synthetase family protein [Ureibacillus chungkukjangi]MCM3388565.1 polyprenyl synthetase family protein [Ureibacillus chungkukjangi]PYF05881.1 geranylgeranyl pyrophosphate synthase [Ureibacillus chungkukjangi]